ncbi:hypothetical protein R1sor_023637 [Riccia sorocarpa]|uniref:C2 domain-containing protein n=1 Tax=Riccia sorocarpa TaxID=122646 RepID=A0ABD3GS88_9MARC
MASSPSISRTQSLDVSPESDSLTDKIEPSARKTSKVFGRGVLNVQIFKARNIKGEEAKGIGKADPYVKVKHGDHGNRVTQRSEAHSQGGSHPVWNYEFVFPLRNGGTMAHNILDIKVFNENATTQCCRGGDTCIGSLRIEKLAEYITSKDNNITEPEWYPVIYKKLNSEKDPEEEVKGEILIKFYFREVDEEIFANGYDTAPTCNVIANDQVGVDEDMDAKHSRAAGKVDAGSKLEGLNSFVGVLSSAADLGANFVPLIV